MARPVRFNLNPKDFTDRGINQVELPDGHMGEGFFATSFDKVVGLARKKFHLATSFRYFMLWYRIHGNHGLSL